MILNSLRETVRQLCEQPAVEAVGWSLLHFLWQGTVVAMVLAVLLRGLRQAPASARYLAACGALVLMAFCLTATITSSLSETARPQSRQVAVTRDGTNRDFPTATFPTTVPREIGSSDHGEPARVAGPDQHFPPVSPLPRSTVSQSEPAGATGTLVRRLLPWCVALWCSGVVLLSARLCGGWIALQRLRHRGAQPVPFALESRLQRLAAQLRISRTVRLLESTRAQVPMLLGWLRPVILLPATALTGLSPAQLEALLAHELGHLRRHDYLVNLVQTAIETVLFYHPAVWWVSRVIRTEREVCCDEIAVSVCGDRLAYAGALAAMEELRGVQSQLALAGAGGPLLTRIRRLVGLPAPESSRSAWWLLAAAAAGAVAFLSLSHPQLTPSAEAAAQPVTTQEVSDWGEESNGLRCRLVAVAASIDDESPDASVSTSRFARGTDVTFVVELKNVSDGPVTLPGVRYGESYASSVGKLASSFFAPQLFEFQFTTAEGEPVPRARRESLGGGLEIHGASTHVLEPEETLTIALRPARWNAPMNQTLPPGEFRATVKYRGLKPRDREMIGKHWPDSALAKGWVGNARSNAVEFEVAADDMAPKKPELAWGEPKDGLRAAVEFVRRDPDTGSGTADRPEADREADDSAIPLNSTLATVFHVQNVSEETITLVSETWRQEDDLRVKTADDQIVSVQRTWYSGWPIMVRWTLQPGETAELAGTTFAVAEDKQALEQFDHPVGKWMVRPAGEYLVQASIRIGSIQSRDEAGNVVIPAKDDWQGELLTGKTQLVVRERTAADDEAARRRLFSGQVQFVGLEGQRVDAGYCTVRSNSARKDLLAGEFSEGKVVIPDCPPKALSLYVRAAGFEEARIHDLVLKPGETRQIEIVPAAATRFRLVSSVDGSAVAGARVRYFNQTSAEAGGGPYPMDGITGPVWAVSQDDGGVLLDSLQKVNPQYPKLGDALYYFYVEPIDLAPRFVGPVRAGEDLGDIELGPFLEVSGEIVGTPEELERFAAEWDQPEEMTTDNPAATWLYAVSQQLEPMKLVDPPNAPKVAKLPKRSFRLSGLRPGKLRIIANFGPRPHAASHTYGRRDPKEGDVVFEFDLTESVDNLVISPQSPDTPASSDDGDPKRED